MHSNLAQHLDREGAPQACDGVAWRGGVGGDEGGDRVRRAGHHLATRRQPEPARRRGGHVPHDRPRHRHLRRPYRGHEDDHEDDHDHDTITKETAVQTKLGVCTRDNVAFGR